MTWRKTPDMTWTAQTSERAAYEMRFEELRVAAEFLAGDDCVQQRFTAVNLTQRPGSFHTSSCFNLQGHPLFYDCEQLRTYALDATGKFVPLRRLSRGGDCVRWITGPSMNELGDRVPWAVLAVVSRDGRSVMPPGGPEKSGPLGGDQRHVHLPAHRLHGASAGRRTGHYAAVLLVPGRKPGGSVAASLPRPETAVSGGGQWLIDGQPMCSGRKNAPWSASSAVRGDQVTKR